MINPNKSGLIYYGTDLCYIEEIDKNGVSKPRYRNEQFISVSISGYQGIIACTHPELIDMARIFSEELKVATFKNGYLHYKQGYINSLTCFQGFGVCPNKYIHTFDGLKLNINNDSKLTVVISDKASSLLAIPDKSNEFEYLSLAIHSFIKIIRPEDIIGYIVTKSNALSLKDLIEAKKLTSKYIWGIEDFKGIEDENIDFKKYIVRESPNLN